jgi:hypothetical protein
MSTFALRTFPTRATESWTSEWNEPFTDHWPMTRTTGMDQARVDLIECVDSFCVYFGSFVFSLSFSLLLLHPIVHK